MIQRIRDSLLSLVYPQVCLICENISVENSADGVVCASCWRQTRVFSGAETICRKCNAFLSDKPSDTETFCHQCDAHFYDEARAVGFYEKALSASILHLKNEPFVSQRLQKLLVSRFLDSDFHDASKIIPVPLSKNRRLERGFNQAAVLGEILARQTRIPFDEHSLIRKVHTPVHRAAMDKKARETSVKNAFEVVRPQLIADENVLLIDDVFTSGATASNCAKALKEKGASKVYVLTIARAI